MDDKGSIDVEESDDEYNDKDNTEKLLAEDEYEIIGSKQQTTEKSKFECDVCKSCFTRKYNLARLMKKNMETVIFLPYLNQLNC